MPHINIIENLWFILKARVIKNDYKLNCSKLVNFRKEVRKTIILSMTLSLLLRTTPPRDYSKLCLMLKKNKLRNNFLYCHNKYFLKCFLVIIINFTPSIYNQMTLWWKHLFQQKLHFCCFCFVYYFSSSYSTSCGYYCYIK